MNRKIFIKGSTLDILNRFEQYSAEEKLSQRPIVLKQLIHSVGRLPEPASGKPINAGKFLLR